MTFVFDDSLVEEINASTRQWRQGDVVDISIIAWLALPQAPLTEHASIVPQAENSSLAYVFAETEGLALITQTCDIVRDCGTRPHVELARVVRLDEPVAGEARRGSRPRFVPVPGAGHDTFADLDIVLTAEKSVLVQSARTEGLPSDADRRRFGRGVGRMYSRFAFPDDLNVGLRGLVGHIRHKHARASQEGRALESLEEIRITGAPSWSTDAVTVFLTFAPSTRGEADEVMTQEEWDQVVDGWLRRTEPFGVIRSIEGAMIPLDELTAREYIDSDPLDLDYLSWAAAPSTGIDNATGLSN